MKHIATILLFMAFFLLSSCNKAVEKSLERAGANRSGVEMDIEHLQYAAAPLSTSCITGMNIPRNRTKGSEERIFTYEGHRQIWW